MPQRPPPRRGPSSFAPPPTKRDGAGRPANRRGRPRPLADLVGKAIDPVLARQGFSEGELILNWDDIVGERLADNSRPIKLQWPPRAAGGGPQPSDGGRQGGQGGAALLVRVEGAFALELQHLSDQILARVNAHFGWRCVNRLVLRQGPIERGERGGPRWAAPAAAAVAAAEVQAAGVEDEGLRAALVRLGGHVLSRRR